MVGTTDSMMDTVTRVGAAATADAATDAAVDIEVRLPRPTDAALLVIPDAGTTTTFSSLARKYPEIVRAIMLESPVLVDVQQIAVTAILWMGQWQF